jgi:peptidoglycan/LPS O-acetylase OafA/YrhL
MANPQNTAVVTQRSNKTAATSNNSMAIIAPVAGWLFPGLGHFIQRRWIRGLLLMLAVFVMFFAGLAMEGKVYSPNTGDLLDILGFFGDLGAGALYFVARSMDWGVGNIHRAVADYGTKYIVVAGLLNVIAAVDAHHIAIGKKQ